MKNSNLKKKLIEDVHDGLRGYIQFVLSQGRPQQDGSIKILKSQVDRWRRIMDSTHSKLRTNEKEWAILVVKRIVHSMSQFKKKATATKSDPRVTEIKQAFSEYCNSLRGFDPIIDHGRDGGIIKERLKTSNKEEILDCFDWFLTEKDFNKFSPSISTALSAAIFNRFLSQK